MPRAKTICIYGASGSSKTTQALYIAKYVKEKYGKNTRLLSADEGGWAPLANEGVIKGAGNKDGIIEAYNVNNNKLLLGAMRKFSMGQWPTIIEKEGKKVRTIADAPEGLKQTGCYIIEGLTSLSSSFMTYISKKDNTSDVTKVLFRAPGYEEGGEFFGTVDRGHYGMVQQEMFNLVQQFGALPVELVVWTAHVGQGEERVSKTPLYGPKLVGSAKTWEVPSWFSDCLHMERDDTGDMPKVRAYFKRHLDTLTEIVYLAKSSTGPTAYKNLLEKYNGGFVPLEIGEGIDKYLREVI